MPTPLRALAAAAVLAFAGGATARPHPPAARHATRTAGPERRRRGHLGPSLARARALLAAVKRDPAKRRYRHHWERAIRALLRAARGADRAPALLEAARARYGLYRLSAVEADREKALRLASRASRAGSREAARLAAAIRREAGDEPAAKVASEARRAAPSRAAPGAPAPHGDDEEESPDPLLEGGVADAAEAAPRGAGAAPRREAPGRVSALRTWSSADYTRIALYLSRPVDWREEELAADGLRPRRLAVDLRPALLEGRGLARRVGDARMERVRAWQRDGDTVRVVLDLAGDDRYQLFGLDDPPRLIVDLGTRRARLEAQAAAVPPPAAAPGSEEDPGEGRGSAERRSIRRIVVDAGHGGHDTGAVGPTRVREKDVVLEMARRLARRLEAAGFEVLLTRRDDSYIPLEERTAIANTARGDLFVSLHANAHPHRDRRGVETYFLNLADGRYAARLAARENGASSLDGEGSEQVQRILSDLDAKASSASSRRLAQLVQREICEGVRARIGEVRDLGVKSALFYVLLGARMPAVLVEAGFVSNREEERRLASPRFQDEVANDVARAISAFAGRESRVAAAP